MNAPDFFPKEIHWRRFKEGLKEIAKEHKPGIILIEQSWCSSCKTVGARFCEDKELIELSNQFVMIACCNEEEPNFDEFRPDGIYYPRFFFIDKDGNIDYSITGGKEGSIYRYFYGGTTKFKENMKLLLDKQ